MKPHCGIKPSATKMEPNLTRVIAFTLIGFDGKAPLLMILIPRLAESSKPEERDTLAVGKWTAPVSPK
jgi:hypothetical protein